MTLFPYHEETDQELIRAAVKAYEEAPPAHNSRISKFAWAVAQRTTTQPPIPRGDRAQAA